MQTLILLCRDCHERAADRDALLLDVQYFTEVLNCKTSRKCLYSVHDAAVAMDVDVWWLYGKMLQDRWFIRFGDKLTVNYGQILSGMMKGFCLTKKGIARLATSNGKVALLPDGRLA